MHKIWRFENEVLEACRNLLLDVQKLLGCNFDYDILMVGIEEEMREVVLTSECEYFTAVELEESMDTSLPFPEFPDEDLCDEDWERDYREYDDRCWAFWNQIQCAMKALCLPRRQLTTVSPCVDLNGRVVALVAIVPIEQIMRYPSLPITTYDSFGRWPSLQFGILELILTRFTDELRKLNLGPLQDYKPFDALQTLRAAGEVFTKRHGGAGKNHSYFDIMIRGKLDLFDACNTIAAAGYERRDGFGGMILADAGHPGIEITVRYNRPILLNKHRRIRKLLEMCNNGLSILSDGREVFGLGRFNQNRYDDSRMDVFTIHFSGRHRWQMSHLDTVLMDVRYGNPTLPQPKAPLDQVRTALAEQFGELPETSTTTICDIVKLAVDASHGAVVVISRQAATEANRLSSGRGIVAFPKNDAALIGAFSIDGAVMIGTDGVCHGVGLILDGIAGDFEDPARGARYNSIRRYFEMHRDCVIVVASEDGMINVLPDRNEERPHPFLD